MKQLFYINPGYPEGVNPKNLSLRIGERHCSFAITNKQGTGLYALAYYTAEEMNAEGLAAIYAEHAELHSSFDEVQLSYDHPGSVLVPASYYHADNTKSLLNTMCGNTLGLSVITETIEEWKIFNVYAMPVEVQEWTSRIFPSYHYRHNYTLGLARMPADPADHMLIDFTTDEFSFMIVNDGKLLIAQTLSYSSPEDILYYLLKACNQFSLSRGEIQLYISGMIEKESQLYRELYLYFLNIAFREPTWQMPDAGENGYPAHFFTSLNDLAQCAS